MIDRRVNRISIKSDHSEEVIIRFNHFFFISRLLISGNSGSYQLAVLRIIVLRVVCVV